MFMSNSNIIEDTDSYKNSHPGQHALDTTGLFMYFAARGRSEKVQAIQNLVWYGLQPILKDTFLTPFNEKDIDNAEEMFRAHMGCFPRKMWEHVLKHYNGYLPLTIRAVPEGTVVPPGHALMTVECTDPFAFPTAAYVETVLERVWYPTTVATISRYAKTIIYAGLHLTSDDPDAGISFKLHDFGSRGVSSRESAATGGAANLVNFMGTDTVVALRHIQKYYNETGMPGFSIPAMEHSTITSWGKEYEGKGFKNMMKIYGKPGGMIACVSDSYDIDNAILEIWNKELIADVIQSGCTVVVRPDSGEDPAEETVRCLKNLEIGYGAVKNSKGFKVLNKMRIIYGDGINLQSIPRIVQMVIEAGYSMDNVAMGMGGALLQKVNRDDFKFAYKCSARAVGHQWIDVFKDPKGDPMKRSKGGRLSLFKKPTGEFVTEKIELAQPGWVDMMQIVYQNGRLLVDEKFSDIRQRAWS